MVERLICPFCGRDDIKSKKGLTQHIKHCKENPDRVDHPHTGKQFSEAHKKRLSGAITKYFNDSDNRQKLSEATKKAMSDPEIRQKLSVAAKCRTYSDETRKKMSEAQKIAQNRPEVKQKHRESSKKALNTPEAKQKLIEAAKLHWLNPEYQQKRYNTMKENNSFNSSKIEEQLKEYFITNNINFKTQYKSKEYPFMCDFYFPDKDLYVEIQGTWTHGKRPYIEDDLDCAEQLNMWTEKSKTSEFYKSAIKTWTISDVRKRNYAKEHKLNWVEIFSTDLDECVKIIYNNI